MAITQDLFMAILSMDSYNRGYAAGIGSEADGLGSASDRTVKIGNATISGNLADYGLAAEAQAAGFYAVAYDWQGQTVISYRGTDNYDVTDPTNDVTNGWVLGGGNLNAPQAALATAFLAPLW